jgi:hypothetical protein
MTTLLQQAVAEAEKLAADMQDAIASRILAEIEDERKWTESFAKTTDDQWRRMADQVRRDIVEGKTVPLDDVLPPEESST